MEYELQLSTAKNGRDSHLSPCVHGKHKQLSLLEIGNAMKPVLILLIIMVWMVTALSASNLSILENSDDLLKLHFELRSYQMNSADPAAPVKLANEQDNLILNNYNLPLFTYLIQVPEGHQAVVSLASPRYGKEHIRLTKTDADIETIDTNVLLSEPFMMRGNRLATLAIQPFIYQIASGTMDMLRSADIQIEFIPAPEAGIATHTVKQTKSYKSWLAQSVLNYRDNSRDGEAKGSLLIIYNPTASPLSIIQPLIDWKHQKGWEVHTVSTSTTGNNTTSIKNYIQNAYDTWENPPEHILLLGRANGTNTVPTYTEYYNHQAVGDYKYTLLDGPDIIPDAYIGRLTFTSSDQLTSMINKTIAYEKQIGMDNSDWYNKALLISDPTQSGSSCSTTIEYIRDLMLSYNPTTSYTYANSGAFPSIITSAIAQGVGVFHYRGHNGFSGLTAADINAINNSGKYPFISFITCFAGNFGTQSTVCPGESFIRAGSTTVPKGAIGFVGASCETHTCLNNIMMGGLAYGLYNEGITSQGQATLRAKLALKACYPQNPANYLEQNFQSINLLGDPSVDIWLKQPVNMNVDYPATVRLTNGVMQVTVTDASGDPVDAAQVCLLKGADEIFQVGYTNSSGVYTFEWATASAGTAKLTITKPNCHTYQYDVAFADLETSFVLADLTAFSALSAGTSYSLPLAITNSYYSGVNNVYAELQGLSEYIQVTSPTLHFGDMTLNQTAVSQENATFTISPDCPQGAILDFNLLIHGSYQSETITQSFPFHTIEAGPDLYIFGTQLGGDNILYPGENSQFMISLRNLGTSGAMFVSAHLICHNPDITITPAEVSYSTIGINQTVTNSTPFMLSAAASMYVGTPVNLYLQVLYNNGTTQDLMTTISIGSVSSSAMSGPDSYGYICVANGDNHPLAKPYNWVEINPSLGGNGTLLPMTDNNSEGSGSWQTVNLTTPFRYYGVAYGQLTICSNGFIMPGFNGSQEWMNWQIPGPMVPRPILAPFWDDLIIQTTSKILYWDDVANQRVIVEWYGLRNKYNISSIETFETIIYYGAGYETPTGDHSFLFQYQTFNNVDAGNYGVDYVDHGQYATVGIADHSGDVGIGYTYQNSYPVSATNLSNNATLFFSTMPNYSGLPHPIVQTYSFIETTPVFENNQIDCGETISLTPTIANTGFTALLPSTLTLSSTSAYVSINSGTSTLTGINPQLSAPVNTPFSISIAPNCPNLQSIEFVLSLATGVAVFDIGFNLVVRAPQIEYGNLIIDSVPAYFIQPQTPAAATMRITNLSNLPIYNGSFSFDADELWTASPTQVTINLPAYGFTDIVFNLQTLSAAPIGESLSISGIFNIPGIYDSVYTKQIYVGNMESLAEMNCEDQDINANWIMTTGCSIAPSSYIHTTGSEIVVDPLGPSNYFLLYSPVIFARDSQLIQVKFNYLNLNNTSLITLFSSVNQSNTWQALMTLNSPQNSITTAECYLQDLPADISNVRFRWYVVTDGIDTGILAIDDISFRALHHPTGMVSGTITLEDTASDPTLTSISTLEQPESIIHPDSAGHYSLTLYRGNYTVIASLDHHLTRQTSNIDVLSDQTISGMDFALPYLQKPVNLAYQLEAAELTLSWQLQPLPVSSPVAGAVSSSKAVSHSTLRSEPAYYKIYLIRNGATISDTTSALNYQRNISPGSYNIYVVSVYLDDLGHTVYSDNSNMLQFSYTDTQDESSTPAIFALQQNYPNPFNPTTRISYSLKTAGIATLHIYNVKGQCVKTLVNAEQKQGCHQIAWDGRNDQANALPSGVYYYRLTSEHQRITRKMLMLK